MWQPKGKNKLDNNTCKATGGDLALEAEKAVERMPAAEQLAFWKI